LISNLYPTISIRLSDTYIKELTEKAKEMEKAQMKELKDFEKWKELPDLGGEDTKFLMAFLQFLKDKEWL
jgi:hypothetical protein